MFYKNVLLTIPGEIKTTIHEICIFVRHFNRPVFHYDFDAVNKLYTPQEFPVFYNKEENDFRKEMCTEVVLEFSHLYKTYSCLGTSKCHKTDHLKFNKTEGRKRAMARALKLMQDEGVIIDKANRQELWNLILPKCFVRV